MNILWLLPYFTQFHCQHYKLFHVSCSRMFEIQVQVLLSYLIHASVKRTKVVSQPAGHSFWVQLGGEGGTEENQL